ncbi:hypothetical protein EJ110_NYTH39816 [Nymphaea thermarum]|nr:hypothetical protein EJ110_NYTH39816 [Nymphaea thermarum]
MDKTFIFLGGLRDEYESIRSQILNCDEIPGIADVYARVESEEQRRQVMHIDSSHGSGPSAFVSRSSVIGHRPVRRCSHCHKSGHSVDFCWDLHHEKRLVRGRPPSSRRGLRCAPRAAVCELLVFFVVILLFLVSAPVLVFHAARRAAASKAAAIAVGATVTVARRHHRRLSRRRLAPAPPPSLFGAAPLILRKSTAYEMWTILARMYGRKKCVLHTYQIKRSIYDLRQGESSVASFYAALKTKWEELDYHTNDDWKNASDQALYWEKEWTDRTFIFLGGLRDEFESVRSQLLNCDEIPGIEEVYARVEAEEQRRQIMHIDTSHGSSPTAFVSRTVGTGPRSRRCSHCNKVGHSVDFCWDLHPEKRLVRGRPPSTRRAPSVPEPSQNTSINVATSKLSEDQLKELQAYINRVESRIAPTIAYYTKAKDMWSFLKKTYSHATNVIKILQLEEELCNIRQGDQDLTQYFATLTAAYERLKALRPPCKHCYASHFEIGMVAKFLSGLSSEYSVAKSQILTSSDLPDLADTYNRLSRLAVSLTQPTHDTLVSALRIDVGINIPTYVLLVLKDVVEEG